MADYAQINNNQSTAAGYYNTSKQRSNGTSSDFDDVLKAQEGKDTRAQSADTKSEDADYRQQLQEHMAQMLDKIKHGTIQPKIQIGAQEYTQDEWKKLLEKFDEAEEELIEQVEEEIEIRMENAEKEKALREADMKEKMKKEMKKETEKAVDSFAQHMI